MDAKTANEIKKANSLQINGDDEMEKELEFLKSMEVGETESLTPLGYVERTGAGWVIEDNGESVLTATAAEAVKIINENGQEFYFHKAAAALGRRGGRAKSERKTAASRENGKLGGRPRKSSPTATGDGQS